MLLIPDETLKFLLMPMVSAQLLLMVLIYFTIVRKRISNEYKLYVCFLATLIFFLLGRSLQEFIQAPMASLILYGRVGLLFGLGMPSLVIASAIYTGVKKTRYLYVVPYVLGVFFAVLYVVLLDRSRQVIFPAFFFDNLYFLSGIAHYHIQLLAIIVLSVIPCSYFFIKELIEFNSVKHLAVLLGGLMFGVLFAAGTKWGGLYWIYYTGSIVPALCWAWAIFTDINEMKGKVGLLKDELYDIVQSGEQSAEPEIDKLLSQIEHLSSNNLTIYKLRLREILSHLIDSTIEAGGDSEQLLTRYSTHEKEITEGVDPSSIRKIARDEALELSHLMADIPNQRIESVKQYLITNYQEDIDINLLAKRFNVSRSYLMREFKKITSQTINQFLTERRIEIAKTLLIDHSVTETAFAAGFNNSNYFSTVFKKHTGQTPVQYQQSFS